VERLRARVAELERAQEARTPDAARLLEEASQQLVASLDYETTLQNIARLAVPTLGDVAVIDAVDDDGTIRRLGLAHADPARDALLQAVQAHYPPAPGSGHPVMRVLLSGQAELIPEVSDELLEMIPQGPEHLAAMRSLGYRSAMVVPLMARGRTLGTITFMAAESGRRYGPADLALAEELARRCALAVDNARLYRAARKELARRELAEGRQRFLAEATAVLAESLDATTTLENLVRVAVGPLADCGLAYLVREDGTLHLAALHTAPEWRARMRAVHRHHQPRLDNAHSLVGRAIRAGESTLFSEVPEEHFERVTSDPRARRALRTLRVRSAIVVPLKVRDRITGAITFLSMRPERRYGPEELTIAEILARRAALAVDNAQLYEQAQGAVRARDAFIALAAHELRTPLTALKGYAELMRRRGAYEPKAVDTILERAALLERLVSDLLDVSRLQTGRLQLQHARVDLAALAQVCAEQASTARHDIRVEAPAGRVVGWWDHQRLEQVLQNLLGNAIKYSPEGGSIVVRVDAVADAARVAITDEGVGIAAEVLPRLFDPFYRAESTAVAVQGLGLGLYVSKSLVEAHGGSVSAYSDGEGRGSTFTFTLPYAPPA
jgi:signal transduction histidine kinase